MSIEYSTAGDLRLDEAAVSAITQELAQDYEVLPAANDHILLRFRSGEKRRTWNEDVAIRTFGDRMYVAVHSASQSQRTTLIGKLEMLLRAYGANVHFEEL